MKAIILAAALMSSGVWAQTSSQIVDGSLTLESVSITRQIVGKAPIMLGTVRLCSYLPQVTTIQPEQVYIATSQIPTMNATDAVAVLTKSYGSQGAQQAMRLIEAAVGGIGIMTGAGGAVTLSARALGWLLGGTAVANQVVIPLITANQQPLSTVTGNTLDGGGPITLAPSTCATRRVFVAKPSKGQIIPASVHFQFEPSVPSAPVPAAPIIMMVHPKTANTQPASTAPVATMATHAQANDPTTSTELVGIHFEESVHPNNVMSGCTVTITEDSIRYTCPRSKS